MQITRIVPNLTVAHVRPTADLLVRTLGLEVGMDQGWIATLVAPDQPTVQLSLITRDSTAPFVADVSIGVDDPAATLVRFENAGADIAYPLTDEPWGVRRFMIRTPDGHILNLVGHH